MTKSQTISQIQAQLAEGNTEKALELLMQFLKDKSSPQHENAILLSGQYKQWKRDNMLGVEQSHQELRRIEVSILEMLKEEGELPATAVPAEPSARNVQITPSTAQRMVALSRNNSVWIGMGAALLVMLLGWLWLGNTGEVDGLDESPAAQAEKTATDTLATKGIMEIQGTQDASPEEVYVVANWPITKYHRRMAVGDTLLFDERMVSGNGAYQLRYKQSAGLVIEKIIDVDRRRVSLAYILPRSATFSPPAPLDKANFLLFKEDCNLCAYMQSKAFCLTDGRDDRKNIVGKDCKELELQDNGRLILFDGSNQELWASK